MQTLTNLRRNTDMLKDNNSLVFGVGVNDAPYVVQKKRTLCCFNGKFNQQRVWTCPYYQKWSNMLKRCYYSKYQIIQPTYVGCSVDTEWWYFSNFIKWVDSQPNRDWENCSLDKDLLVYGNKKYGPTTCVFISKKINNFIMDKSTGKGSNLLGVHWCKASGKFKAQCKDPFGINSRYLGLFETEMEAHLVWKSKKHEYACHLAELQEDPRVADVLRNKYRPSTQ
jgi:hypothetical protein